MARLAARLLMATASLLVGGAVAAAAGEAWLRRQPVQAAGWPPRKDNPEVCVEPSLTRGYAPIPGTCGRDAAGAYPHHHPGTAPHRVLLLGDSVSTHKWVGVLADGVAARLDGEGLELENAAVSGYDWCQEAATWDERREDPDLVVLQTCPNDLTVTPTVVRLPGGAARASGPEGAVTFPGWFLGSRLLTEAALRFGAREPGPKRDRELGLQCLARLVDDTRRAGVPLLVLDFPAFDGADAGEAERWVSAQVAALGVDAVPIRPLLAARDPALLVSSDHLHPDRPEQAAALGELLAPVLAARLRRGSAEP